MIGSKRFERDISLTARSACREKRQIHGIEFQRQRLDVTFIAKNFIGFAISISLFSVDLMTDNSKSAQVKRTLF